MRKFFVSFVVSLCSLMLILPVQAFAFDIDFDISNGILLKYNGYDSTVNVPEDVYEIADNAFDGHSEIKSITFEGEVFYIGNNAFSGCSSLNEFNGLENVVKIGENAFNDTPWYDKLDGDLKILNNTVIGCEKGVTEVILPENIISVAPKAFYKNTSLKAVSFNKKLTEIGSYAFFGCTSLEKLSTLHSLQYVGFKAFEGTKWLSSHNETFVVVCGILIKYNGKSETVNLPSSINQIGSGAFFENDTVKSVFVSDSLYYIGESAFEDSTLSEFNFGNANVVYIGKNAFKNCSSLTELTLNENVQFIGSDAFYNCDNITLIVNDRSTAHIYALENNINYKLPSVAGDLDNDGVLSMQDVVILQKYIAKLIDEESFSITLADIDGSGKINMQDVTYMQKKIAKLL